MKNQIIQYETALTNAQQTPFDRLDALIAAEYALTLAIEQSGFKYIKRNNILYSVQYSSDDFNRIDRIDLNGVKEIEN